MASVRAFSITDVIPHNQGANHQSRCKAHMQWVVSLVAAVEFVMCKHAHLVPQGYKQVTWSTCDKDQCPPLTVCKQTLHEVDDVLSKYAQCKQHLSAQ